MYEWAIIFLIQAGIAAIFAFSGIALRFVANAELLFYLLLAISLLSFFAGLFQKKKTSSKRLIIDIK